MKFKLIYHIAKREYLALLKNGWTAIVTLLFLLINFTMIHFSGNFSAENMSNNQAVTLLSLLHIYMYIIPLFAMILSYDTVLKERELKTFELLLTYPVSSCLFILGKWLGQSVTLIISIIIAFIISLYVLSPFAVTMSVFLNLILSCILLSTSFISIGLFISTVSQNRTYTIALTIIIWLFFIFLFDLLFVLLVVTFNGVISSQSISVLLLLSPIDLFRIQGILSIAPQSIQQFYGVGEAPLSFTYCVIWLVLWSVIPLVITMFRKYVL
ncbi:ABC transporter permease [Cysteiniphilum sp. 6C5]|uniref:ABC transporter permease n=1 Tax=unclassified Cysteiniphilum TaxID=2610889 RepID=UPI003F82F4AB